MRPKTGEINDPGDVAKSAAEESKIKLDNNTLNLYHP
jgi:hypothetical protein